MNRREIFRSIGLVVGAVEMPRLLKANAVVSPVGDSLRAAGAARSSVLPLMIALEDAKLPRSIG
ncbi:MAG: hypothetical protein ACKO1K_08970 [Burkholderiales bacterium]